MHASSLVPSCDPEEKCDLTDGRRSIITSCKSSFNCLAKDASVPEDQSVGVTNGAFVRGTNGS